MAKPTKLPEWATDGAANIVEPNLGKKVIGWAGGERPPAAIFNWFWNLVYQWLAYLDAGALEGDHSVNGDLTLTGALKHGTRTIVIPAFAGFEAGGTSAWFRGLEKVSATASAALNAWVVPVSLPAAKRITAIRAVVEDASGTALRARLRRAPHSVGNATPGAVATVGSESSNSDGSGNVQSLAIGPLTEAVIAGQHYAVEFEWVSGSSGLLAALAVEVDYDEI